MRNHFVLGSCMQRSPCTLLVERADRLDHPRQAGLLLREFAGTLVGAKQISSFHQRQPRAALAVASNLASRTYRKLALTNAAEPLELRRVIPDIAEPLAPQVSCRLRQLHTGKDLTVRRNVTAVVARTARQVFVSRALDSARNGAPKCRLEGVHGACRLGRQLRFAGVQHRISQYRQQRGNRCAVLQRSAGAIQGAPPDLASGAFKLLLDSIVRARRCGKNRRDLTSCKPLGKGSCSSFARAHPT